MSSCTVRTHGFLGQDLPPHVFAVSESAYSAMKSGLGTADQSIIVSGESGAGKVSIHD